MQTTDHYIYIRPQRIHIVLPSICCNATCLVAVLLYCQKLNGFSFNTARLPTNEARTPELILQLFTRQSNEMRMKALCYNHYLIKYLH